MSACADVSVVGLQLSSLHRKPKISIGNICNVCVALNFWSPNQFKCSRDVRAGAQVLRPNATLSRPSVVLLLHMFVRLHLLRATIQGFPFVPPKDL